MISLIVKGTRWEAARAAARHGVPFSFVREVKREGSLVGETVLHAPSSEREKIAHWFHDGSRLAPFPVGTLLLYTEQK